MCTVSYVPHERGFWLHSNRDERLSRKKAEPPGIHVVNNRQLLCPRDGQSLGTWIVSQEEGAAAVLLNGAFHTHTPQPAYRMSRGLVLLQLMASANPLRKLEAFALNDIEPFTLILWQEPQLYEFRWDGQRLHDRQMDAGLAHIWSSVTLYAEEKRLEREEWFRHFLKSETITGADALMRFHLEGGEGDPENALLMQRGDLYGTVSITQLDWQRDGSRMLYLDTITQQKSAAALPVRAATRF
jgi:hypothetical protein